MVKPFLFILLWLFIAAVSAFDAYLLVLYGYGIIEENPAGQALIDLGGVPLFASLKLLGTTIACSALTAMYGRAPDRITFQTACGVAILQFLLLLYLVLK